MAQLCPLALPMRSATLLSPPPLSSLLHRAPVGRARLKSAGRLPHWLASGLARNAGVSLAVSRPQSLVVGAVGQALLPRSAKRPAMDDSLQPVWLRVAPPLALAHLQTLKGPRERRRSAPLRPHAAGTCGQARQSQVHTSYRARAEPL